MVIDLTACGEDEIDLTPPGPIVRPKIQERIKVSLLASYLHAS